MQGVASVAGVREQNRVNRDVDLALLEEPGGFLSSEASWEMRQGRGNGRGSPDTCW